MRLSILICLVANLCTFHFSNTNAQNLAISSGYSNILNIFTINVIDEVLTKVGEQEVEPNFTFLEIGADGQSVYFVHEVTEYGDFGETGAVSFWRKGRDISGNVLFQKMEVLLNDSKEVLATISYQGCNVQRLIFFTQLIMGSITQI